MAWGRARLCVFLCVDVCVCVCPWCGVVCVCVRARVYDANLGAKLGRLEGTRREGPEVGQLQPDTFAGDNLCRFEERVVAAG